MFFVCVSLRATCCVCASHLICILLYSTTVIVSRYTDSCNLLDETIAVIEGRVDQNHREGGRGIFRISTVVFWYSSMRKPIWSVYLVDYVRYYTSSLTFTKYDTFIHRYEVSKQYCTTNLSTAVPGIHTMSYILYDASQTRNPSASYLVTSAAAEWLNIWYVL